MSGERCCCQKAPEGHLGWDRSMVSPDCPVHGALAVASADDPIMETLARLSGLAGGELLPMDGQEVVAAFARVLRSDDLVSPGFAVRLAVVVKDVGREQGFGIDEQAGLVTGAAAMYRALTGRTG